ncbi:MAG TPA: glycosyltransferase [Patescibacteria group bacterium]|nr:glycosyltransferase [Patescibacteria group bacterium]
MNILFSIIIPTLNEEKYLPLILSDLAQQQKKNFEIIVVDGKSTDKTKQIANSFVDSMPLTFFEVDKRNVSYQRNFGAKKGKGQYFVFLDADTRIPKDFTYQLQHACFQRKFQLVLPTIAWDDKSRKGKILMSIVKSFIRASQVYGRPLATGGNFAIERHLFEKIGGFNEKVFISEDHDIIRRAYEAGVKAKIVKNVKAMLSLRRSEVEGDMMLIYKHVVGFLAYTVAPSEKALQKKLFEYEMGGQRYLEKGPRKSGSKKNIEYLRQLLQLSSILVILRYFQRF